MTKEKQQEPQKIPALRITARREGFRRAGRAWSTAPDEVPASEFSAGQIAALKAEPLLLVVDIDLDARPAEPVPA
jgi:hypothetical protein